MGRPSAHWLFSLWYRLRSQLKVCQQKRGGVKKGGCWRTLRVPHLRHGGQGRSWCHELCCFTPGEIPWKFHVYISIRRESERGVKKGGTRGMLRDPDQRSGLQGGYPDNVMLILEVCQEGEGTWRRLMVPDQIQGGQGHMWCHGWCFFTQREVPWNFRIDNFIRSMSERDTRKGGTWRVLRVPDLTGRAWSSMILLI